MPKIQQLSPLVADMIAAGEVVERPASAAKELVENAIDAGAHNITVEMKDGGMTFLRVTDDGCGMSAEDAETAFLRHATSKLHQASDLEAICTLGFRGEALAAISAVSRIDLLTRTADAEFGVGLHLDAGKVTERGEAGCPKGTTIIVRDLFYNTPARMKFMKRDTVEASALLSAVQRLALAHPEVALRVLRDGEEQLRTVGDGKLYSAVYAVLGKQSAQEMLRVESHYEKYQLSGYVSKPTASRGNRTGQIFFVNGRHIRSKAMTAALEEAYRNRIMVGRFPMCVLHLHLPEHLVDVNVHPTKTEVKFLNERDVFDCIRYGVQGALERESGRVELGLGGGQKRQTAQPKQDFFRRMSAEDYRAVESVLRKRTDGAAQANTPNGAALPTGRGGTKNGGATAFDAAAALYQEEFTDRSAIERALSGAAARRNGENPAAEETITAAHSGASVQPRGEAETPTSPGGAEEPSQGGCEAEKEAVKSARQTAENVPQGEAITGAAQQEPPVNPMSRETGGKALPASAEEAPPQEFAQQSMGAVLPEQAPWRIVGEVFDTYIIVEQNREMLLIDKHAAHERILFEKLRLAAEPVVSQLLIQPILCKPESEEAAILLDNAELLNECGFEVADYGDGTLAIRRIPADLDPAEAASALEQLASDLHNGRRVDPATLRDTLLHTVACKAAIKGGWHTDPREREALVRQVLSREDLKYCPHGRPIVAAMTEAQLERRFKRA